MSEVSGDQGREGCTGGEEEMLVQEALDEGVQKQKSARA